MVARNVATAQQHVPLTGVARPLEE